MKVAIKQKKIMTTKWNNVDFIWYKNMNCLESQILDYMRSGDNYNTPKLCNLSDHNPVVAIFENLNI